MRKPFYILGLAAIHFIGSRVILFMLLAIGMGRFDAGTPMTSAERFLGAANTALQFPLVTLAFALPRPLPSWFHGPVEYVPFILNSLLWASGVYFLAAALRRAARNRSREMPLTAA
jgi:hypothetical protein